MGVRRIISGALIASLALGIVSVTAGSASALSGGEQSFVDKINAERKKRGLSALVVKSDLVAVARRHSARMAADGSIWHNPNVGKEVDGWTVLGENVGMGPTVDSLHGAFMNSKGHRDNILYGAYNQIGVGNVVDDGTIYTTHVFVKRGSSTTKKKTSSTTTTTKTRTTTTTKATSTPSKTSAPAASAPAPAPKQEPKPKPKPKPVEPAPRTVDLLVRMVGFDAETVDPATGMAAGF